MKKDKKKILIVDDDPDVVDYLKLILEIEGYHVIKAYNAQETLIKTRDENPDLIFLDIRMPGMNGYDACKIIKANHATRDIPILLQTAVFQKGYLSKGEDAGGDGYILKPFSKKRVLKIIEENLEKSNSGLSVKEMSKEPSELRKIIDEELTQEIKDLIKDTINSFIKFEIIEFMHKYPSNPLDLAALSSSICREKKETKSELDELVTLEIVEEKKEDKKVLYKLANEGRWNKKIKQLTSVCRAKKGKLAILSQILFGE